MKLQKIIRLCVLTIITAGMFYQPVSADTYLDLTAKSAILVEEKTGKILYAKEEHLRLYPASMTKVLTASLALDHLKPDELIVVGNEIKLAPFGSSLAKHIAGETITVENLIRGLIIPSGNESANTLAVAVVKKVRGVNDVNWVEAEKEFTEMMNEKARNLGAVNSNFMNPHGFHDNNHYSTAYDMALICREAMEKPLIRQIVAEQSFTGNGAGIYADDSMITKEYTWESHNELIMSDSEYYYPYATGIKTGFTDEASDTLAASAIKDGKNLIAVVFYSPSPGRWLDCAKLFQYGFDFFDYEVVQEAGVVLDEIELTNVRLGHDEMLEVLSSHKFTGFLSKDDVSKIKYEIVYDEALIAPPEEGKKPVTKLVAPVEKGQVLGKVVYTIDDTVIYEDDVFAAYGILERTPQTDREYKIAEFKAKMFSLSGLPYWLGLIVIILLIAFIIVFILGRRRRSRGGYNRLSRRY